MNKDGLLKAIEDLEHEMRIYKGTGASLKSPQYSKMALRYADLKVRAKDLGLNAKKSKKKPKKLDAKLTKDELRKALRGL